MLHPKWLVYKQLLKIAKNRRGTYKLFCSIGFKGTERGIASRVALDAQAA